MKKNYSSISPLKNLSVPQRTAVSFLPMVIIFSLNPYLPLMDKTPAIYLYTAVFLATWLGGSLSGFGSTFVCLIYSIFILKPHLLVSPLSDIPGLVRTNIFFWTSLLFVTLILLLEKALKKANDAIAIRDEFISMASHELKTPLTTTKLNLEVLKKMLGADSQKVEHVLSSLERQSFRHEKLVNNIVDVSLIEVGQLDVIKEVGDLKPYVDKGANSALYMSTKGFIDINTSSVSGFWDGKRIEQVVFNLVHNALKYGSTSPVTVSLNSQNDHAVIKIKNSGNLFHQDHKKLFFKFGRSLNQESQGLGMGLFIAKSIVEMHDGSLRIDSQENETVLTVTLPVVSSRT